MSYPGGYNPYGQGPGQQPPYAGGQGYPPRGTSPGYPTSEPYPGTTYPPQPYPPQPQPTGYPPQNPPSYPYPGATPSYPTPYPTPQGSSYPPQGSGGYPPQGSGGYPPQVPGGYSPQTSGGYPPLPSGAYPPQNPPQNPPSNPQPMHTGGHGYGAPPNSNSISASHAGNAYSAPPGSHKSPQVPLGTPTIRPHLNFDPIQDAEVLRKAMKGLGTNEKAIIEVLTRRTNAQRQEITNQFKQLYGKDLIQDLKKELGGKFEDLIIALMTPTPLFLARELHHAMSGIGTKESTLVEVMCTATNNDIRAICAAYEKEYGKPLESELANETSGSFKRLMVSLCQGHRSENPTVDMGAAAYDAQALHKAGEMKLGTDESTFNAILCSRSNNQLKQIFAEYHRLTGHEIDKAIRSEFSGDVEAGLLALVHSVRDRPGYFAEKLHESLKGMGTNDRQLIRIVVTRSEIDMGDIKSAYQAKHGRTLEAAISGDTSGDYKKGLIALIA